MSQYGRTGFGTDDLVGLASRQRVLEFAPGTKWDDSNTNYVLLAEIVARVSGKPSASGRGECLRAARDARHVFPGDRRGCPSERANAYHRGDDGALRRSLVESFEVSGCAHAFSTIEDMAKWIENLRTGKVGGLSIIEKMQERPALATGEQPFYGAGLGIGEYRGVRTVGHSGQTGAFKTELIYCPDLEVGVVVLAKRGGCARTRRAAASLDFYLARKLEPLPDATRGRDRP